LQSGWKEKKRIAIGEACAVEAKEKVLLHASIWQDKTV
jgi:hypothetical protein